MEQLRNLLQNNITNYLQQHNPNDIELGRINYTLGLIYNNRILDPEVLFDALTWLIPIQGLITSPQLLNFNPNNIVGNGKPRKIGGNIQLIEMLRNDIRRFMNTSEYHNMSSYEKGYWAELSKDKYINYWLNHPNEFKYIVEEAHRNGISLNQKLLEFIGIPIPRPSTKSEGRGRPRKFKGAGLFDLISPIANMFSGTSFNTPLDSIIPREVSTQIASHIADEGLGGSRKKPTKKGKGIFGDMLSKIGSDMRNTLINKVASGDFIKDIIDIKDDDKKGSGRKTPSKNPWIAHVKDVASKKGITYREALKIASKTYKK